jgi:hypothetical protein
VTVAISDDTLTQIRYTTLKDATGRCEVEGIRWAGFGIPSTQCSIGRPIPPLGPPDFDVYAGNCELNWPSHRQSRFARTPLR